MSEFHAEAPQLSASEGLAQGPYVAARARFERTTLRMIGVESINEPPILTLYLGLVHFSIKALLKPEQR